MSRVHNNQVWVSWVQDVLKLRRVPLFFEIFLCCARARLLTGGEEVSQWRSALLLMAELEEQRLQPNVVTVSAAVSALEKVAMSQQQGSFSYMSYSLNSLKGVVWGIISGTTIGDIKGDTRSLDYSSYKVC